MLVNGNGTYDRCTQNMLRTCEGKQDVSAITFKFATSFDRNKCLKKIEIPISLHTCVPISELPSDISTMDWGMLGIMVYYGIHYALNI